MLLRGLHILLATLLLPGLCCSLAIAAPTAFEEELEEGTAPEAVFHRREVRSLRVQVFQARPPPPMSRDSFVAITATADAVARHTIVSRPRRAPPDEPPLRS